MSGTESVGGDFLIPRDFYIPVSASLPAALVWPSGSGPGGVDVSDATPRGPPGVAPRLQPPFVFFTLFSLFSSLYHWRFMTESKLVSQPPP